MPDEPREYGTEYTVPVREHARRRVGYTTKAGDVVRFVVQLEYELSPGEWHEVVRADHDARGADEMAHDVTEEGVHLDVYRQGAKVGAVRLTGPLPADRGFTAAEEHLTEHAEGYLNRFEAWHQTNQ